MRIEGCTALVTGAGRGLGRAFAEALVGRGARAVYGGARDPGRVTTPGVTPIALDVTDPGQVAAAAERCRDVTLLVNNAGILHGSAFLDAGAADSARAEMEVNYFGTLAMCRAFAPVLGRAAGGGALVNMLSVVSFFANPRNGTYGASKSAAWSLTNSLRTELRHQGTLVVAVHAGFIDTDMAAQIPAGAKISPAEVARQAFDAVEAGQEEVLAEERTRRTKANLSRDQELIYPGVQETWDSRPA
jgi:NAD(P)-dependent dehydrogenase (short-subunit alcohol dehydrogenase family)